MLAGSQSITDAPAPLIHGDFRPTAISWLTPPPGFCSVGRNRQNVLTQHAPRIDHFLSILYCQRCPYVQGLDQSPSRCKIGLCQLQPSAHFCRKVLNRLQLFIRQEPAFDSCS